MEQNSKKGTKTTINIVIPASFLEITGTGDHDLANQNISTYFHKSTQMTENSDIFSVKIVGKSWSYAQKIIYNNEKENQYQVQRYLQNSK